MTAKSKIIGALALLALYLSLPAFGRAPARAGEVPPPAPADAPAESPHRIVTHAPGGPLLSSPILARLDYYRAVHEIAGNDWTEAEDHLQKAADGDPSLVRAHLLLALARLRHLEPAWILSTVDAGNALAGNFRAQTLLLANSVILLLAILGLILLAARAASVLRALPALRHGLVETIPGSGPPLLRLLRAPILIASVVLLFRPWGWGPGIVWLTVAGLFLTWKSLDRHAKVAGASFLLFLALSPVLLRFALHTALPSMPGTTLFALSGTSPAPVGEDRAPGFLSEGSEDEDVLFTLALLERERGNRDRAADLYREILNARSESPAVYNNLGNLLFVKGDIDRALTAYKRSLALDPERATSHYNLGQLYLELFSFDQARAEFSRASEIDFALIRSLSHAGKTTGSRTLVDDSLPPGRLWGRFFSGESLAEGPAWPEAARLVAGIVLPGTGSGRVLLVAVLLAAIVCGRLLPGAVECLRCGKTLCRKCRVRVAGTNRCPDCAEAGRDRVWHPSMVLFHRPVAISLGLFLPGLGHYYLRKRARGIAYASLALLLLFVWIFRGPIIKPFPVLHAANLEPLQNLAFAWLFVPFYLFVLLDLHRLTKRTFREIDFGRKR